MLDKVKRSGLRSVTMLVVALGLGVGEGTAQAAPVASYWRAASLSDAKTECESRAYLNVGGVYAKVYDCRTYRTICRWAGAPYKTNVGTCVASWTMRPKYPGFKPYLCTDRNTYQRTSSGTRKIVNGAVGCSSASAA